MAWTQTCDICGKIILEKESWCELRYHAVNQLTSSNEFDDLDICNRCRDRIHDYINTIKEIKL